jgi:hypothetical protein
MRRGVEANLLTNLHAERDYRRSGFERRFHSQATTLPILSFLRAVEGFNLIDLAPDAGSPNLGPLLRTPDVAGPALAAPESQGPAGGTKTFVVLGMHRSGTSVIAGILESLGVKMIRVQPRGGWPTSWANPTGYLEDPEFVDLDNRILGLGSEPGSAPIYQKTLNNRIPLFRKEIQALVMSRAGIWGWKNPWTVLTVDFYLASLRNPYFILCRRNHQEVLTSLDRHGRTYQGVKDLIMEFEARLNSLSTVLKGHELFEVDYNDLLKDPHTVIARLVAWSGLHPTVDQLNHASDLVLSGEALRRAKRRAALRSLLRFPFGGWNRPGRGSRTDGVSSSQRSLRLLFIHAFRTCRAIVGPTLPKTMSLEGDTEGTGSPHGEAGADSRSRGLGGS